MFKIFVSLFALTAAVPARVSITVPARKTSRSDGLRRSALHCVWRRDAASGALRSYWFADH